jgi:RND family efflux transporter MFP subunit
VLFELDDAEPRAALRLAQAEVKSAEATLRQAQQQLSRFESLGSSNAISRHDVDNARMQRDVASAALEQAKARLDARRVTLSYTRITSPIDGRVGHSSFHVGSLVNPASGVLVEVVQLDPIRIAFALEEGVCRQSRTACGYQRHEACLAGADRQQRPARQRRADVSG